MADPTISITELRIDGQSVVFAIDFTGAPELEATSELWIYDSSSQEKGGHELYRAPLSEATTHAGTYDLPAGALGDGDFAAWIEANLWDRPQGSSSGAGVATATKGVSFLVGRGRVYPSTEAAPAIDATDAVKIDRLRLEGTWLVFDLVNSADHDVAVDHSVVLVRGKDTEEVEFPAMKGRELVNAKATQSAHHLLPENLADGEYTAYASAQVEGSQIEDYGELRFQVNEGALTVAPGS